MVLEKVKTLDEIISLVAQHRRNGDSIVFANGCFDLLHVGHIRYLEAAQQEGDVLVLGLNTDESVRVLKGKHRPFMNERERAEIVASLECVDYVVVFQGTTADRILKKLEPDVHAKGTDYTEATVPEYNTVLSYGGKIAIVGDSKNHSTQNLLERIKDGER